MILGVSGQDQRVADSIVSVILKGELDDSTRCYWLGRLAYNEFNPVLQKEYALQQLHFADSISDLSGMRNAYYFLGYAEKYLGNYEESLKAFLKSITHAEKISKDLECEALIAIGDLYSANNDFENGLLYYHKAINELKDLFHYQNNLKIKKLLAIAYLNTGDTYYLISKLDSAMLYFENAQNIFKELDNKVGLAYSLGNMGLVYASLGDHNQAESNINQAIATFIEIGEYYAIASFYTYMADIYLQKNEIEQALYYAQESYEKASEYNLKEQMRDASLKLYELYEAKGDYAKALKCHVEYVALKDSVTNMESVQKMANLRTEYEVGQKQTEVDLLIAEKKIQQVILWSIVAFAFLLVILAVVIYVFYRSKMRTNKILEEQKLELERVNSTKDKFFSIISHDLRGPVQSFYGISRMIKYLVETKDTEQLLEITEHIDQSVAGLTSLLDNLLGWAMQQQGEFPYAPEAVALKPIAVELEATFRNMAQSKKIGLSMEIAESITLLADKNMIATAIRNLVNNALKFTKEGDSVIISAQTEGNLAHIQIKDTGVGIPADKLEKLFGIQEKKSTYGTSGEKGLGLGLQLVYEFVGANKGCIEVESEVDKGTTFHLFIPVYTE